jgi:hypothetical protein
MLNLLQTASDDQTAIGACILTLGISALFVFASFHLGPAGQKIRKRSQLNAEPADTPRPTEIETSRERAA